MAPKRKYPFTCNADCICGGKEFPNPDKFSNAHRNMSDAKKPKLESSSMALRSKIDTKESKLPEIQKQALQTTRTVLESLPNASKIFDGSIFAFDKELVYYLEAVQKDAVDSGRTLEQIFEQHQSAGKMDMTSLFNASILLKKKNLLPRDYLNYLTKMAIIQLTCLSS